MNIKWLGHSTFKISGDKISIIHDPYKDMFGYKLPNDLECDLILSSHDHQDHNYYDGVNKYKSIINTTGEHEYSDIKINGINSFHDDQNGHVKGNNIIFKYKLDGYTIAHLGDLGHVLDETQVELLSDVDILLIPCGGGFTIGSEKASEVVKQINPKIIIPMHYRTKALSIFGLKFEKVSNFTKLLDREVITLDELNTDLIDINNKSIFILDYN